MSDGDVIIGYNSPQSYQRDITRLRALEDTECIVLEVEDLHMLREKRPSMPVHWSFGSCST